MVDQRIGNYRIVRKLGEGGMGVVFEVIHEYIGRRAAVKVLHADFSKNPEMAVRFLNEARAANIVQHPGIVNIFEFDRLPDGSAYIVMDYLDGDSLTQRLAKLGGRMEVAPALVMGWQIAEALASAHSKGVIHRDLKPDNIMIVPDQNDPTREQAKILDFGIAKVAESQGLGPTLVKTQIGVPMGTPLYMAPEQWKGASEVEDKADVYSLGVIMYEMLAGQPPFIANSSSEVMALHILAAPRSVREYDPTVPEEVAALLHQMLGKTPTERPSMLQVARELRRMVGVSSTSEISLISAKNPFPPGVDPSGAGRASNFPGGLNVPGAGISQMTPIVAPFGGVPPASASSLPNQISPGSGPIKSGNSPVPAKPAGAANDSNDVGPPQSQTLQMKPSGANQAQHGNEPLKRKALYALAAAILLASIGVVYKLVGPPLPFGKPKPLPVDKQVQGGLVWSEVPSTTNQILQDVWGTGANNLWAVGKSGTILRWNGAAWAEVPNVPSREHFLYALWGSAADDIWAVGKSGVILHYNGVSWSEVPSGDRSGIKDVWGTSKDNVWAVGEGGLILRWNGTDWNPVKSASGPEGRSIDSELRGIWGSGPNDIWIVGGNDASDGCILHWDGKAWSMHSRVETRLNAVWGSHEDDVWAVGGRFGSEGTVLHWDGRRWTPVAIPRSPWLNSIWGSSKRDIWVVGDSGFIMHWNGSQWGEAVSGTQLTFKSVFGTGPNDVWAVAVGGLIRHWNGKTWLQVPAVTEQSLERVFGSGQNDVWAVGRNGAVVHWDGKTWSVVPSGTTQDLHGLTASGFNNIWACGDKGTMLHWAGKGWEVVPTGVQVNLYGLFALDPQDMWAVGEKGTVLHWNGQSWTPTLNSSQNTLFAVFGVDSNDVWAAGDQGLIEHWDGRAWLVTQVDPSVTSPIYSLYGSSTDEVWASGKQGLLIKWNGRVWQVAPSGTNEDLSGLFGAGRWDVWSVGTSGVILHWNGTTWTKILSGTRKSLASVWSSRPGDLWIVGQWGLILH